MTCPEVLARLDLLTPSELAGESDQVHLRDCPHCQEVWARRQQFDAAVRDALLDVPIPAGLEERLLAAVAAQEATAAEVPPAPQRTMRGWSLRIWATMAAAALLAVGLWWWQPVGSDPQWDFADLQTRLSQQLATPAAVEQLTAWNAQADVSAIERELRRLRLTQPKGLDLDTLPGHDAAVYAFRYQQWSGVVIAIPSARLEQAPQSTTPTLVSQQRLFAWRSGSGDWTYVCQVHSGPAQGLMQSLFGGMA